MIRFGAIVSVVAVAIGLLIAGAVSGDLGLVYISIGLAALALLMLVVGVAIWRDQVFGTAAEPANAGRPAYSADGRRPDAPVSGVARQRESAARAEAAVAELDRLAGRKAADRTVAGQGSDASAGRSGRRPASDPGDWNRVQREQPAWDWPERPQVQQDRPQQDWPRPQQDRPQPHQDRPQPQQQRPVREPAASLQPWASGEAAKGSMPEPVRAEPPRAKSPRAKAPRAELARAEPARAEPAWGEPVPAAAAGAGPADDPTRLARRLDSAAELSRKPGSAARASAGAAPGGVTPGSAAAVTARGSARRTSADPLSADPLNGPPPGASGRTRLQKDAEAAAAAKSPATSDPDSIAPATAASAPPQQATGRGDRASGRGDTVASSTSTGPAKKRTTDSSDTRNPPAGSADARVARAEAARAEAARAEMARAEVARAEAARAEAARAEMARAEMARAEVANVEVAGTGEGGAARSDGAANGGTTASATTSGAGADSGPAGRADAEAETQVSVVPGIARYHKADCILIRFLSKEDLQTMTRQAAEASGCAPCRACRPEKAAADA